MSIPEKPFIQAPIQRAFKILMQGPPWGGFQQDKIFAQGPAPDHVRTPRGFHQDLFKSSAQGPVQGHAKVSDSISLGSPQDLHTRTLSKIFMPGPLGEFHKIVIQGPGAAGADLTTSWCKNLARASHKSFHTSTSTTWHLQAPHASYDRQSLRTPRHRLCASPRARKAHGHVTRAILCEKSEEKIHPQKLGAHFVRACAVEMHLDISRAVLCENLQEKCRP